MKVRLKAFVHQNIGATDFKYLHVFRSDMSEYGYLLIGEHEFDYEIPDHFNPVAAEVAVLEKKLDSINKEHADQVRTIKQRINDLLCIEHTPSAPSSESDLYF